MSALSEHEQRVVDEVHTMRDELVALASELISYDTTARGPGDPPRDEEALQRLLESRWRGLGAETDLWEPASIPRENPFLIPAGLDFHGRPQLAARLPGKGGGRSLLFNGHIDAVDVEPRSEWTSDPFMATVVDGRLCGRGSNDMKGGLAALVCAAEALKRTDTRLLGDIVFCSNTDEESSGAGGWAAVQHGVAADAGICAEPSSFDLWTACRGAATAVITVTGRTGHAEMPQPHWTSGGAVNAIERMLPIAQSLAALREEWQGREEGKHALLSPSGVVPTVIEGGTWLAMFPGSCRLVCDVHYLPPSGAADAEEPSFRAEVEQWVRRVAAVDPWIAEHPVEIEWIADCLPAEVSSDHELVTTLLASAADVGRPGRIAGMDSWHDAATFTLLGGTPTVSFGPGGFETAHGVDEYVPLDDLIDLAAAVAVTAARWCGVA